jgi:hypothetical protein
MMAKVAEESTGRGQEELERLPGAPLSTLGAGGSSIVGFVLLAPGTWATFDSGNQAGAAVILVMAAALFITGIQGTPPIRVGKAILRTAWTSRALNRVSMCLLTTRRWRLRLARAHRCVRSQEFGRAGRSPSRPLRQMEKRRVMHSKSLTPVPRRTVALDVH